MKKMQIFEPALCCDTGVCGASVDTELLRITTVLNTLKQNGVVIDRFNLKSAPMEFVTNQTVNVFVNQKGIDALPCVLVDGEIVIEGRYPTNEEILKLLELSPEAMLPKQESSDCCCCGESEDGDEGCCCGESENGDEGCCCGESGDSDEGSCCSEVEEKSGECCCSEVEEKSGECCCSGDEKENGGCCC